MKKDVGLIGGIVALLCIFGTAHATIWYVHPDSTLNSIQAGIGLCSTGDTVLVGPGTYVENINFNGMAITVTSEYGADTTIIDGSNPAHPDTGSVVLFVSGEDTTSVLNEFTLMNGSGIFDPVYDRLGGGIYCVDASPIISGNTITDNTAYFGGGIFCLIASPFITDNTISGNNVGMGGGGISCNEYCSPTITGNTINSNTAYWGGGIGLWGDASPYIKDNAIDSNYASWGAGIVCWTNCSPTITGNTITDNVASTWGAGIHCSDNSSPNIDSNTISNNTDIGVYCELASNPEIHYNNIFDNNGYGVCNVDPSDTIDAANNWWGDPSGPYHPTANPGGLGNAVSDYVDFVPWDTVPYPWGIEEHEPSQPVAIALQISPNPFRVRVDIRWQIADNSGVNLKIYDATGRMVKDFKHVINQQIFWNGTDDLNRKLPSGVYFLKFEVGEHSTTEKLLMIR
jgi:parallel beta-helix repeat protein